VKPSVDGWDNIPFVRGWTSPSLSLVPGVVFFFHACFRRQTKFSLFVGVFFCVFFRLQLIVDGDDVDTPLLPFSWAPPLGPPSRGSPKPPCKSGALLPFSFTNWTHPFEALWLYVDLQGAFCYTGPLPPRFLGRFFSLMRVSPAFDPSLCVGQRLRAIESSSHPFRFFLFLQVGPHLVLRSLQGAQLANKQEGSPLLRIVPTPPLWLRGCFFFVHALPNILRASGKRTIDGAGFSLTSF